MVCSVFKRGDGEVVNLSRPFSGQSGVGALKGSLYSKNKSQLETEQPSQASKPIWDHLSSQLDQGNLGLGYLPWLPAKGKRKTSGGRQPHPKLQTMAKFFYIECPTIKDYQAYSKEDE